MTRKAVTLLLLVCLVAPLLASPLAAQAADPARPYLKPGEYAHRLKPVHLGPQVYDLYYITTQSRRLYTDGSLFTDWVGDTVESWERQVGITGVLVLRNGMPVRDPAELFQVLVMFSAEIFLTRRVIDETQPIPKEATEALERYFSPDYALLKVAFVEQEILELFRSEPERYAEPLRLMLVANKDSLGQQALDLLDKFASGAASTQEAVESLASFTRYNNDERVREKVTGALEELLTWWRGRQAAAKARGWTGGVAGGYDLEIEGIRVKGAAVIDCLKVGVRFLELRSASAARVEMLKELRAYIRAKPARQQCVDPALLAAMDQVIAEAESAPYSAITAILEFVRDKAVGSMLSTVEGELAREWARHAFKSWGTRTTGHMMAGAASGLLLGYSISNLAFGLDSVHANTYNAHYARLIHDSLGKLARHIRQNEARSAPYVDAGLIAPYRASFVFCKLAEVEFFRALAERSDAVWSLKIIIDFFTKNSMTEGIQGLRGWADTLLKYLLPAWVTPPVIDRAIELARFGPCQTSTVLVMDLSTRMNNPHPTGTRKLAAAKQAARELVTQLGQDNTLLGTSHEVAIATFSEDAQVAASFTDNPESLLPAIDRLATIANTNLGAGFALANRLLASSSCGGKRFIILMTDGAPNRGLTTLDQFLAGPVAEAEKLRACVMAVGFGADVREDLLRGIAKGSQCGGYYSARSALELRTVYAQAAAQASGGNVEAYTGTVAHGQRVLVGTYHVAPNQAMATFQLLWPGSTLELALTDPAGRELRPDGDRVRLLADSPTSRRLLVKEPKAGRWRVEVIGVDVPDAGGERFSVVTSTVPRTAARTRFPWLAVAIPLLAAVVAIPGVLVAASRRREGGAVLADVATGRVLARVPAGASLTLGRATDNALVLADPYVSRHHAVVVHARGRHYLQDQGSKDGTYVNGERVDACELHDGDEIRLGNTQLVLRVGGRARR